MTTLWALGNTVISLVQLSKLRHRGLRLLAGGTQAVNGGDRFELRWSAARIWAFNSWLCISLCWSGLLPQSLWEVGAPCLPIAFLAWSWWGPAVRCFCASCSGCSWAVAAPRQPSLCRGWVFVSQSSPEQWGLRLQAPWAALDAGIYALFGKSL